MTHTSTSIRYETPAPGVARVVLARPEKRNAQDPDLLYALDSALMKAAADTGIKVIILAADGPDFSSGHDLTGDFVPPCGAVATMEGGFDGPGVEGHYAFEHETYLGLCKRWRNLPKPTIAQVQGRAIAGGLMLVWPMDLIVAAESATFVDPVTAFGVNGVEFFVHPWEVGHRRAKEMLFTGEAIGAREAHSLGMVNRVVPDDELQARTLELAQRIATRPAMGLRLAKESVNFALDAQGQSATLDGALAFHNLGHANNMARFGGLVDPESFQIVRADSAAAKA
ncbi:enoyl-CoA hydratase [Streptomyces adustus]|uniref:enoyl-CoA hydratase n=1 Tax=Streptomyces adustus TaxID=1609272 RepID=UPI00371B6466